MVVCGLIGFVANAYPHQIVACPHGRVSRRHSKLACLYVKRTCGRAGSRWRASREGGPWREGSRAGDSDTARRCGRTVPSARACGLPGGWPAGKTNSDVQVCVCSCVQSRA